MGVAGDVFDRRIVEGMSLDHFNYAIHIIDEVERAKIVLSTDRFTIVQLTGDDVNRTCSVG